jgi:MFS family permease
VKKLSDLHLFRAFRSLNYTLYFTGRAVSQFGTYMQRVAVVWVIYSLTHSAFLLGVTVFAEQFPSFLFSIPGGVAADRYNQYTIIRITQITSIIQAVLLAILIYTGHTVVWEILTLSVLLGIINAFDVPARQALINDVVADPADLPNALSLTTATANLAQLLGPAAAGIILNVFGAPVCFLANAASFGAVLLSLLLMKLPAAPPRRRSGKNIWAEFAEAFEYLTKTPSIGFVIGMLAVVSLLVLPFATVLPVFARVTFKGNASTFGYILSAVGVGSVIGTIFLASRKPGTQLRKILFCSTIIMGLGLICFSQATNFPLALVFAAVVGIGAVSQFTVCNIIVQSESEPHLRGRVIGILLMAVYGMVPLGSVMVGAISQHLGAPATVLWQGIIGLVLGLAGLRIASYLFRQ